MGDHPTIDELQQFLEEHLAGENRPLNRRVLRHLISGCSSCRECLEALSGSRRLVPLFQEVDPPEAVEPVPDYDEVLARTEEALSLFFSGGRPVEEPPASLLAQLAPLPGRDASRRGSSLPLMIRWMVGRSHAARFDDPEAMQSWALMARLAAETCSAPEAGSSSRLADLRGRAWAQFGNGLRVKGGLRVAEEALRVAEENLARGTGDLSLRAWFLGITAVLSFDQGKYQEAAELAGQAAWISSAIEETEEEASRLLTQANAWREAGDAERAIHLLKRALARPEFGQDPQWQFIARHNLGVSYASAGQEKQALALLLENSRSNRHATDSLILLRSLWQQGELLLSLGHTDTAEAALQRAYRGFIAKQMPQQIARLCRQIVALNRQLQAHDRADRALAEGLRALRAMQAEPECLAGLAELGGAA